MTVLRVFFAGLTVGIVLLSHVAGAAAGNRVAGARNITQKFVQWKLVPGIEMYGCIPVERTHERLNFTWTDLTGCTFRRGLSSTPVRGDEYKVARRQARPTHHGGGGGAGIAGCDRYHRILTLHVETDKTTNGTDVQLTPVLYNSGSSDSTLTVIHGKTVTNTLEVSKSFGFAKGFIQATLGVSYSQSWSSSDELAITFSVQPNHSGAGIVNPLTRTQVGLVTRCFRPPCDRIPCETVPFESVTHFDGPNGFVRGPYMTRQVPGNVYPVPCWIGPDGCVLY